MLTEERMTIDERYKYLRMMKRRYWSAGRKERSRLLSEMEAITGMHRKSLTRLMRGSGPERKRRRKQRGRKYGAKVDDAIRVIGATLDWICAERLQPALPKLAQHLANFDEMEISDELIEQLESISISTVYRIVKRIRQDEHRLPQRRGKRRYTSGVAAKIPTRRIRWDEGEPGHFETDLVHHSGPQASGDYICSLQLIDVATGWSERAAIFGRSQRETVKAFEYIRHRCPIPFLEIHPDNGSEFMNHHLLRYFGQKVKGVTLSRSRPYQKPVLSLTKETTTASWNRRTIP